MYPDYSHTQLAPSTPTPGWPLTIFLPTSCPPPAPIGATCWNVD